MNCPTFVNSTICVEANVKINAEVEVGEVDTYCVGRPCIRRCRNQDNKCVYMVFQKMRVRFPLIYSTNVTAHSAGVACESVSTDRKSDENCQDNRGCCQEPGECCQKSRECCQEPDECCQEPREWCQEIDGCCQEPRECCQEPGEYCQKPRECYQEPSECCQELSKCYKKRCNCCHRSRKCAHDIKNCCQEPGEDSNQQRICRNKFNFPFVIMAALLFRGRCPHF